MADDLRLSAMFQAIDATSAAITGFGKALTGFSDTAKGIGDALSGATTGLTDALSAIKLGGGGDAAKDDGGFLKQVGNIDEFFRRFGLETDLAGDQLAQFRGKAFEATIAWHTNITETEAFLTQCRQAGGSVAMLSANMDTASQGIAALYGHGAELGTMFGLLEKSMKLTSAAEFKDVLATASEQMKNINNGFDAFIAAQKKLIPDMAALGHIGVGAEKQLSGLFAVVGKGNSIDDAKRLTDNLLKSLNDQGTQQKLEDSGIKVFKDANNHAAGQRDVADIVKDIVAAYAKNPNGMDTALGKEMRLALSAAIADFKDGHSKTLDDAMSAKGNPSAFAEDAKAHGDGLTGALNAIHAKEMSVGVSLFGGAIGALAQTLSALGGVATGVGLTFIGFKGAVDSVKWVKDQIDGMKSLKDACRATGNAASTLGTRLKGIGGGVAGALKGIGGVVGGLGRSLFSAIPAVLSFSASLLACPVTWIVAVIAAFCAAAYAIYEYWGPIKEFFLDLWDGIGRVFDAGWARIQKIVGFVSDAAKGLGNLLGFGGGPKSAAAASPPKPPPPADGKAGAAPRALAAPIKSAYAQAAEHQAGKAAQTAAGGLIRIVFDNLPPGARPTVSSSHGLDISVERGHSMVGA